MNFFKVDKHFGRYSSSVLTVKAINICLKAFVKTFHPLGTVLDIGSYYTEDFEALCNRRPMFEGRKFIGCDIRKGPGVDLVEDAQGLSFADSYAGTVLLLEILEHIPHPQLALSEAKRVLKQDGLLFASIPFTYRLHGFPNDYRRLTASGLNMLLLDSGFESRMIFSIGPEIKPTTVFAVAQPKVSEDFESRRKIFCEIMKADSALNRIIALNLFQERFKDFAGLLLGRAKIRISFYNENLMPSYGKTE